MMSDTGPEPYPRQREVRTIIETPRPRILKILGIREWADKLTTTLVLENLKRGDGGRG